MRIDPAIPTIPSENDTNPEREKLRKATRQVEGYFVGVLLKKMHETSSKSKLFPEDSGAATYRDMFDEAIASEIGKRGAFGIADTLYKKLVGRINTNEQPTNQSELPSAPAGAVESAEAAAKRRP